VPFATKEPRRHVAPHVEVPSELAVTIQPTMSTQMGFGQLLNELGRLDSDFVRRIVTTAPDVTVSTNLGPWVNRRGLFAREKMADTFKSERIASTFNWEFSPKGQHIELGIAENNLFIVLSALGLSHSINGERLFPIGTLYDPFIARGLDALNYACYQDARFILVATPSGITLAPEGGAHQSITTPSVGLEQPGCVCYEPAFAIDVEWTLLASLARLGRPDGISAYLRLSTRPVDQTLAAVPSDPAARERRRRQVVAGAYPIRRGSSRSAGGASIGTGEPDVTIVVAGAMVTEALAAANRLAEQVTEADVVVVTSPGLLFEALQARSGHPVSGVSEPWILDAVFPARRAAPMVTLLDGHPHTLSFLAGVNQVRAAHLGVTRFGQSGDLASVYRYHGIDADGVVAAALDLL
jgi:pyruvate dehydrogenase E1 component